MRLRPISALPFTQFRMKAVFVRILLTILDHNVGNDIFKQLRNSIFPLQICTKVSYF